MKAPSVWKDSAAWPAVLSPVVGFALMCVIVKFSDWLQLPVLNLWAMMHGMWLIVWPALTICAYLLLRRWQLKGRYSSQRSG
jgi:hypothetical protein